MTMLKLRFLAVCITFISIVASASAFGQATLTSDKDDYPPGDTATLTGAGFFPGESVTIEVGHADGTPDSGADHEPWTVVADENGGFVTTWHVCEDDCLGSLLRATADGQSSSLHAEVTFWDGTPIIQTVSISPFSPNQASSAGSRDTTVISARNSGSGTVSDFRIRIHGPSGALIRQFSMGSVNGNTNVSATWNGKNTGGTFVGDSTYTIFASSGTTETTSPTSAVKSVVVDNTNPTVSLNSPANGAFVSGNITLDVSPLDAGGNDANIARVEFYVDGILVGTDMSSGGGWNNVFNTAGVTDGGHTWHAKAFDKAENNVTSATRTLNVQNTGSYTATISPITAITGTPVSYTITVTNTTASVVIDMGSVTVAIPAGIGTPTSVTVTATDPGLSSPLIWSVDGSSPAGFMRFSRSGGSVNDVDSGGTVVIQFTATATTTGSKEWTTTAFKNNNYTQAFSLQGAQPAVTACTAISITTNPISQTVCAGNSVSFSAAASSTPTPSIQWQVSTDGGATWNNISGATSSPLTFTATAVQHRNQYRAVFSNTCGTANSTAATLTVDTAPVITCPANITVSNDSGVCSAVVNFIGSNSATATGSPAPTITYSHVSGTSFPVGITTVKAKATNTCGVDSCTFTVTVHDTEKPEIACPANKAVNNDPGVCTAVVNDIAPVSSSDNCPGAVISYTLSGATSGSGTNNASGSTFNKGLTTVTYKITDASGNKDSCSFTVTVNDNTPPVIASCPGDIIVSTGAGRTTCDQVASWTAPTATDNCAMKSFTSNYAPGATFPKGVTTVTYTAVDSSGNESTCSFTVTVNDNTPPVIASCPGDIVVSTGTGRTTCDQVASWTAPTATDNCAMKSFTSNYAPGATFPKGVTTVTYTAVDSSGNESTCSFTVTVNDNTPPIISCPSIIETLTDPGVCSAVVNFSVTATDNCTSVSIVSTPPSGSTFPKGTTIVKSVATDAAGNKDSCTFTVTVNNPAPVVTITGPPSGSIYAVGTPVSFTGTFTDNIGDVHDATWMFDVISSSGTVNEGAGTANTTYTFTAAGVYMVKLTVTDQCGNSTTTSQVDGLTALIVVYDPNAGFVTGGGWINSPKGSYRADTTLTGKANFGFVSKYKKGATTPTGQTEFQYQVANFKFHSSVYDWMVVSGAKAQYKGSGMINNAGDYGFILTATDGQINGGGGIDKFRIKIVNKTTGEVIYDNQFGSSDTSAPTTALAGGSIVIHTQGGGNALARHGDVGEELGNSLVPKEFAVYQNYPNPFNPATEIRYDLPTTARVTLKIYNVLGNEVQILVDEIQDAGFKSVSFDGNGLASGMYFYRITAGTAVDVKKMLLIK